MFSPSRVINTLFVFTSIFGAISYAQSSVDLTYNAVPSLPLLLPGDTTSVRQAIQTDGKILVWGDSVAGNPLAITVQGVAKGSLARLNSDGTLDNSFSYCHCGITFFVNAAPLPDGKILVAGANTNVGPKVIRLNNDGSLDPTFNFIPPASGSNSYASIAAVQPDGRFFITRTQSFAGNSQTDLYHFNADGSSDASFSAVLIGFGSPNYSSLGAIKVLTDGRFYVAINTASPFFPSTSLKRYLATGAVDTAWQTPGLFASTSFPGPSITGLDTQTDGSVLVSGDFETVNGVTKPDLVRLHSLGNVDLGFTGPAVSRATGVDVLASGKVLFSSTGGLGSGQRLYRLSADGTLDDTYVMDPSVTTIRNPWVLDATEQAVFAAGSDLVRLQVNGTLDVSFNPNIGLFGQVHALQGQTDGKILMAGNFTQLNGLARSSLARVNADGTLDSSFNVGTGFNLPPTGLVMQTDGKIIAAGLFNDFNGTARQGIARLNADGTLDTAFAPVLSQSPKAAALQSDGKILIVGSFNSVKGVARTGIARLNTDGTLDNGFNPIFGAQQLRAALQQADGKIMVGGIFSGVNGFSRSGIVRLNSDGSLDQSFNAGSIPEVNRILVQSNGKYLFASTVTIVRLNIDGTSDGSFVSPTFDTFGSNGRSIEAFILQPDGTLIVGGRFDLVNGSTRRNLVRLTSTGGVDGLFFPGGADAQLRSMIRQPDGKIVIGGDFAKVEGVVRAGVARLTVAPFRMVTPFDFEGDGRADITVYRPSTFYWYQLLGINYQFSWTYFGASGDILTPADFDGDGKTDISIFRPSSGIWVYASSANGGTQLVATWGHNGDIPLPSDFNGDGKADFIVYRPSTNVWYRLGNGTNTTSFVNFGAVNDKPVIGDFDGDGKSDPAVFRPSTGEWFYASSRNGGQHLRAALWGLSTDQLVPADYDGDGKTDPAIYRDGLWAIYNSSNGSFTILTFGLASDKPVAADYDGDGKADVAVFRPSDGTWYLLRSTSGFQAVTFGASTDIPAQNAYVR